MIDDPRTAARLEAMAKRMAEVGTFHPSTFKPVHQSEEVLTRAEAARLMRVSPRTLDKWKIPMVKVDRIVRIRRRDLDAFMQAHVIIAPIEG